MLFSSKSKFLPNHFYFLLESGLVLIFLFIFFLFVGHLILYPFQFYFVPFSIKFFFLLVVKTPIALIHESFIFLATIAFNLFVGKCQVPHLLIRLIFFSSLKYTLFNFQNLHFAAQFSRENFLSQGSFIQNCSLISNCPVEF